MILIGHPDIPFSPFEEIQNKEDIKKTAAQSVVLFAFDKEHLDLCHYAREEELSFALKVTHEADVILASAIGASYIICDKELAVSAQKFADDYLFDAKILLASKDFADITWAAHTRIDGLLFEQGVKQKT